MSVPKPRLLYLDLPQPNILLHGLLHLLEGNQSILVAWISEVSNLGDVDIRSAEVILCLNVSYPYPHLAQRRY